MGLRDEEKGEKKGVQIFGVEGGQKKAAVWIQGCEENGPAAILHAWGLWVSPDFQITIENTQNGQLCRITPTESYKFKQARQKIEALETFTRGSADR